ncbi:LysR family transcriptional regulator [Paraburkholderia bannensis]|uniref:LysR family transcriptional regulator n=1 Tax=Paraburkholderia bannensis TaxID=765414 RepID=UPI0038CD8FFE
MEAFVRIIETGSFSAAARQLRVGQPAISKAVAQLEERLGTRLLSRSTRGLTPTEAGQGFYERARRALDEANEADLAATGAGTGLTGRLRFSATVTFARLHVMPLLPAFLEAHPALTVEAILDDRSVDLIGENIDIALRMGDPKSMTVTGKRIATSRRVVVATSSYLDRHGTPERPDDLPNFPAVIYTQGGGGDTWTFKKGAKSEVVTLKNMISTTAAEGVREAVFAGMGLAVSTEWMFQPEIDLHRVETVLRDWTLPSLDLWAVYPAGRQATAKARAFAAFISECLAKTPFAPVG